MTENFVEPNAEEENLEDNEDSDVQPTEVSPKPTIADNLGWYFSLVMVFLFICSPGVFCSLYYLSIVPDVTWQRGSRDLTLDRVWMVQSRGPIGIGYQSQRVSDEIAEDQVCVANTVRYFLWRRPKQTEIENTQSKTRFVLHTGRWQSASDPC